MGKILFYLIVLLQYSTTLVAQQFSFGAEERVSSVQLISQNYVPLSIENGGNNISNFDVQNYSTFLKIIYDEKGAAHHVLYQTQLDGKINYLAISKELEPVFNCKKTNGLFRTCLNRVSQFDFTQDVNESILGCVLKQLNSCQ